MHHHEPSVTADVDISLDHLDAELDRPAVRLRRVLGHLKRVAAVGDDQGTFRPQPRVRAGGRTGVGHADPGIARARWCRW